VIVGNSAAAIGAVEGIRSVDKQGNIILISDEPYHTYSRPLISYYLAGKVTGEKMYYRPTNFYEQNGVRALLGKKVLSLDTKNKEVAVGDNFNVISYDRILLATGGKPFIPPLDGVDKKNVFTFIKWDDVKKLAGVARKGARAVIIGGGLIGLKAAEALTIIGVKVTVVELADRILSAILDGSAASMVQSYLEDRGIEFELNTTCEEVLGNGEVEGVKLKNGKSLACDFLVIAIGMVPNTDLTRGTSLEVNRGIIVNERMQTNLPEVYAAGDVAEGYDVIHGERRLLPILPNAYKQGETAGINMAGGDKVFPGGFAMNSIGFFGLYVNTAGIVSPEPDGEGKDFEVLVRSDPVQLIYKKIVLRRNKIVGFILLNEIDRSGILTGLMSDRIPAANFKDSLLEKTGLIFLPDGLRHDRQSGGAA